MSYRPEEFDSQSTKRAAALAAEARALIPGHIADYIDRGITSGLTGAVARIVRNTLPEKILPSMIQTAMDRMLPTQEELELQIKAAVEEEMGSVMPTFYQLFNTALDQRSAEILGEVEAQIKQSIDQIRWEQRKVVLAEMRLIRASKTANKLEGTN